MDGEEHARPDAHPPGLLEVRIKSHLFDAVRDRLRASHVLADELAEAEAAVRGEQILAQRLALCHHHAAVGVRVEAEGAAAAAILGGVRFEFGHGERRLYEAVVAAVLGEPECQRQLLLLLPQAAEQPDELGVLQHEVVVHVHRHHGAPRCSSKGMRREAARSHGATPFLGVNATSTNSIRPRAAAWSWRRSGVRPAARVLRWSTTSQPPKLSSLSRTNVTVAAA